MGSQAPAKPSSQGRTTTLNTRQTHCTHSSFTREFSSHGRLATCQMCKRGPDLGWVYACTEDQARMDARDKYPYQESQQLGLTHLSTSLQSSNVVQLNASIEHAIKHRHYTPKQVELVKAQRAVVLETIKADYRARRDPLSPETQSRLSTQDPEDSEPTPANPYVKVPSSTLLPACHGELGNVTIPSCRLRVCPGCMPTATERSWQSLNCICTDDYMTDDRLLDTLAAIAININDACASREFRKVPTPASSLCFDIADALIRADGNGAADSNAMDNAGTVDDGANDTCPADLEESEITPPDVIVEREPINKTPRPRKSLKELLHFHRSHAKEATGPRKKNTHRHHRGRDMGMEFQIEQRRTSENTRPQKTGTERLDFPRRVENGSPVRRHEMSEIDDDRSRADLEFVGRADRFGG
ncbi:hypothetical protein I7I51_06212 [Histoplasma capsulatum]|uniref:Uncharacterized protein n=1 Tax=Ajellomyces capsulatus TaxID=5037 RepID=A0A8A1MJR9_AJECA|nr:hypothetical protein I7I51_06212 [Histoplasma capsulatum]